MLPLSHDEVVYGKKSIAGRMPGDEWQKFANLRLLYGYMFTHPGTKLLFMGAELAQSREWNFAGSLDWDLLQYEYHSGIQQCITDLNALYKNNPAFYERQFQNDGFEWINHSDHQNAVIAFIRKGTNPKQDMVIVCNMTPLVHATYRIGLPKKGKITEVFNSDNVAYGGSGVTNPKPIKIETKEWNGRDFSTEIVVPPLGVCVFKMG